MITYEIAALPDFSDKAGELMFMLDHVRAVTKDELKGLTAEELDFLSEEGGNTIGSLLMHIAAIEKVHQVISFEGRDFNESELQQWGEALFLSENSKKGRSVDEYIHSLNAVRSETREKLAGKTDEWLYEKKEWPNGVPYNNYYLWFHVLEDEINHRGQIRAACRSLRNNSK